MTVRGFSTSFGRSASSTNELKQNISNVLLGNLVLASMYNQMQMLYFRVELNVISIYFRFDQKNYYITLIELTFNLLEIHLKNRMAYHGVAQVEVDYYQHDCWILLDRFLVDYSYRIWLIPIDKINRLSITQRMALLKMDLLFLPVIAMAIVATLALISIVITSGTVFTEITVTAPIRCTI